jgi:hypothetical protein
VISFTKTIENESYIPNDDDFLKFEDYVYNLYGHNKAYDHMEEKQRLELQLVLLSDSMRKKGFHSEEHVYFPDLEQHRDALIKALF